MFLCEVQVGSLWIYCLLISPSERVLNFCSTHEEINGGVSPGSHSQNWSLKVCYSFYCCLSSIAAFDRVTEWDPCLLHLHPNESQGVCIGVVGYMLGDRELIWKIVQFSHLDKTGDSTQMGITSHNNILSPVSVIM